MPADLPMRSVIALLSFLALALALFSCSPIPREESSGKKGVYALAHGKSANLVHATGDAVYSLEYLGSIESPLVKQPVQVLGDSPIVSSGWAIDGQNKKAAGGVDVAIDGYPYGAAYGNSRGDVAEHFKSPDCENSGFKLSIPVADIGKGASRSHHPRVFQ